MTAPVYKRNVISPDFFRERVAFDENGSSDMYNLGDRPMANWTLQVYGIDEDGELEPQTAWNVQIKGSLNGQQVNSGDGFLTHVSGADADGNSKYAVGIPFSWVQFVLTDLTLADPTSQLVVVLEGTPASVR
jgi:hypothetical protein